MTFSTNRFLWPIFQTLPLSVKRGEGTAAATEWNINNTHQELSDNYTADLDLACWCETISPTRRFNTNRTKPSLNASHTTTESDQWHRAVNRGGQLWEDTQQRLIADGSALNPGRREVPALWTRGCTACVISLQYIPCQIFLCENMHKQESCK